jgi:hypothetical protein
MAALPLAHPRAQLHVTFQSIGDGRKGQALATALQHQRG